MWWYMLSTLTNDRIKKKINSRHCHIDFIALKEMIRGGGGGGGGAVGTNDTPYMNDLEQERRALVR